MKRRIKLLTTPVLIASLFLTSCGGEEKIERPTVSATDIVTTIAENPRIGQSLGFIGAEFTNTDSKKYILTSPVNLDDFITINNVTGQITVSDSTGFDYETTTQLYGNITIEAYNKGTTDGDKEVSFISISIIITDIVNEESGSGGVEETASVQKRLNDGETPFEIYTSNNSLLDSLYGKTYLDGLIFHLNTADGKGMVAASVDQRAAIVWDPNTSGLVATGATSTNIGDGEVNTFTIATIIGTGDYGASICSDLVINSYTGWFMPTLDELSLMYTNLHAKGLGSFQNSRYWASSEIDANNAWFRDFSVSSGQTAGTVAKYNTYGLRAFRKF